MTIPVTLDDQISLLANSARATTNWSDAELLDWTKRAIAAATELKAARRSQSMPQVQLLMDQWITLPPHGALAERCELAQLLIELSYWCCNTLAALDLAVRAVSLARAAGNPFILRKMLNAQGVLRNDSRDYAGAVLCFDEALTIARASGDRFGEAAVWNNLGAAGQTVGLFEEAFNCFDRVVALTDSSTAMRSIRAHALSNIALGAVLVGSPVRGFKAAKAAVDLIATPTTANEVFTRCLAESVYTQLLIEIDDFDLAQEHCKAAMHFAALGGSERLDLTAELAAGLYDVYVNVHGTGLTRLRYVLERARSHRPVLFEALTTLVKACERAGLADEAAGYLRELSDLMTTEHKERFPRSSIAASFQTRPSVSDAPAGTIVDSARVQLTAEQLAILHQVDAYEHLALTADLREDADDEHLYRVGRLSGLLAIAAGLDERAAFMITVAGRLHDIGKLGIPDTLLRKKEALSVGERALLKQHTTIGAQTLADAELSLLPIAKDIAHCHHEHWNGTGFPMGLSGEAIPLPARIVAVADVFDSLCYSRVTPHQASIEEALDFIHRGAGTHFDPRLCTLLSPLIQKLQREHDNLAVFLGADAHRSPFVNARRHIATTLWQDASASGEASQAAYR